MPLTRFHSDLYAATVEAAELLRQHLTPIPLHLDRYQKTVAIYFVKAYKTYRATYHLLADGFDEDAICLNRNNLEALFHVAYLLEGNPNPKSESYQQNKRLMRSLPKGQEQEANKLAIEQRNEQLREHNLLARMQHYLELKEFKRVYRRRKNLNRYFDHAIKRHEESRDWDDVKAAYKRLQKAEGKREPFIPKYWADSGVKNFCKWMDKRPRKDLVLKRMKFNTQFWAEQYLSVYKEASVFVHTLGLSLEFYIEQREDGSLYFSFDEKPNTVNSRNYLRDASTLMVCFMLYNVFALKLQKDYKLRDAIFRVVEVRNQKHVAKSIKY